MFLFGECSCEKALGWNLVLKQIVNASEEWNACEYLRDLTQDSKFLVTGRSAKLSLNSTVP